MITLVLLFLLRKRERDEGESERERVLLVLLRMLLSLQSPMKNAKDVEAPAVLAAALLKGLVLLAVAVVLYL